MCVCIIRVFLIDQGQIYPITKIRRGGFIMREHRVKR